MELGQRLKQARLDAGLSQRQLCGSEITRNMLSQIENGSARPSMTTLQYLAAQLGKPVSFFLEEDSPSPNQTRITTARAHYEAGRYPQVKEALAGFQTPDAVFDPERGLLLFLTDLALAETAITENRLPLAKTLLQEAAAASSIYITPQLERHRLLLLAEAAPEDTLSIVAGLPADDRELILRAEAALRQGDPSLCAALLDVACNQNTPRWYLLRGDAAFALAQYTQAAEYYLPVEDLALHQLERCYERLKNYEKAYYYACKQRK